DIVARRRHPSYAGCRRGARPFSVGAAFVGGGRRLRAAGAAAPRGRSGDSGRDAAMAAPLAFSGRLARGRALPPRTGRPLVRYRDRQPRAFEIGAGLTLCASPAPWL